MGMLSQVLTLPLAPVRGAGWIAERLRDAAEQQYYDPAPVRRELAELEQALLDGRIDEEEFDRREDELLERFEEIRAYRNGGGGVR